MGSSGLLPLPEDPSARRKTLNELHLFAGIGGGILAGELLGHTAVGAVEVNPHCRSVLRRHYPNLPIHDDIRQFDATPYKGRVDIVAGGFPCQDISAAGKGRGLKGSRSGLWFEMLRVVRQVEPLHVFVENSPLLRTRGLDTVLAGLAELGFDAEWDTLSAQDVGAPHLRKRLWLLATHPDADRRRRASERQPQQAGKQGAHRRVLDGLRAQPLPFAGSPGLPLREGQEAQWAHAAAAGSAWWSREPDVVRVADGSPRRVERLTALGNAQVPLQAAYAFRSLQQR